MKRERLSGKKPPYFVDLMLDSGAFSAWSRGESLQLGDYVEYVHRVKHLLSSYVVLDVLPFGKEASRSEASIEACASASYENLQFMKKEGLEPIPVFHQGERFYWLERMLDEGEPYIGLSTRKDLLVSAQRTWLDKCFTVLTKDKGLPLVKTHGFGVSSHALIQRYPWFTVDSTAWSLVAAFGKVWIPQRGEDGRPDYSKPPVTFACTDVGRVSTSVVSGHHGYLAAFHDSILLDWVLEYLQTYAKISIAQVRNAPKYRRRVSVLYLDGLARSKSDWVFHNRSGVSLTRRKSRKTPALLDSFRVMHAGCRGSLYAKDLTAMGVGSRLLSYYEIREQPPEVLEEYVTNGFLSTYKPRKHYPALCRTEAYRNFRALALLQRLEDYENEELQDC